MSYLLWICIKGQVSCSSSICQTRICKSLKSTNFSWKFTSDNPNLLPISFLTSTLLGNHRFVLYVHKAFSVSWICSLVSYFRFYVLSGIMWYLSFYFWLHLVWPSPGPSMLLQMALFHSFIWLSSVLLYIYIHHILLIHSSVSGHLGCFHV